jgi:hypothetical protein
MYTRLGFTKGASGQGETKKDHAEQPQRAGFRHCPTATPKQEPIVEKAPIDEQHFHVVGEIVMGDDDLEPR